MTLPNNAQRTNSWELRTKWWWRTRGDAAIRHAIEVSLCAAIVLLSWQLATPSLPHKWSQGSAHNPLVSMPNTPGRPTDSQTLAGAIVHDHLFGVIPQAAPTDVPASVASTPEFQLNGIVYSSNRSESIALLNQGGVSVVAHSGMQLSDGQRIVSIEPDRVVVDRQGIRESVLLDLKKADINAHFSPAQFADSGSTNHEQPNDISASNSPTAIQEPLSETSNTITGNRPTLVTPHFKSLRQLRGRHAMRRFQDERPPAQ